MALVDNLISYYSFERNANDLKSTNDGIITLISWHRSLTNFCAKFNSSTITIPNDASLQITGVFTISFQIRPYSLTSAQTILHKSKDNEYSIVLETNGGITFYHGNGTSNESFNVLNASSNLSINEKAHIVIVRTASNIITFKNGQQINNTSYSLTPTTSTNDITIGAGDDSDYNGELDELAIWNTDLDSDLVAELYNLSHLKVYDSTGDKFVESDGYKQYSLLVENGDSSSFWTELSNKERYLAEEEVVFTSGGLTGYYYDNIDFTDLALTRKDSTIDFDWGNGSPDPSIADDTFSIRWEGYLLPDYSETYTLYIGSDDGTRLYIDGTLLIDNWADQAYNQVSNTITLTAGQYYPITIEYYESSGGAEVDFYWSSTSQTYEVVPSTNLYTESTDATYKVYSSISAWQTDQVRDLATRGEKEILDIRGQWSGSVPQFSISGWATDVSNDYYVVIQALNLAKPEYIYFTSTPAHFRVEADNNSTPAVQVTNTSIEFINIHARAYDDVAIVSTQSSDTVRFIFSYLYSTSQLNPVLYADQNAGKLEVFSSILRYGSYGLLASVNNTGQVYIVDSTITECNTGIESNDTLVMPSSCAIFNNDDDFSGSFAENWPRFCASDDNDVGVEGIDISPSGTESSDWDNTFVDYANGDYRIASETSVLYDAGEPYISGEYSDRNILYLDVAFTPRTGEDIGALTYLDWFDYHYSERLEIVVPASEVATDLTDFTLYIDLSKAGSTSGLWKRAKSDGSDIRVTTSTRRKVPFELVFFDQDLKDGEIWAKVDVSSTTDTTFHVYYNYNVLEEEPSEVISVPLDNAFGQYEVWSDYVAVWHLQSLDITDSTPNGHDGTVRGTPTVVTDGRFGYSIEWNETGAAEEESADVGVITTDASWTGITLESWFRKDTTGDERMICKSPSTTPADHIFALHSQDRGNFISTRIATDITEAYTFDGNDTFTTGEWQFGAAIWDQSDEQLRVLLNGQPDVNVGHPGDHIASDATQQVEIANVNNSTTNRFWEGGLDEIRVAKKRFPNFQERLEAQYNNQTSDAFGGSSPDPDVNPVLPPPEDVDVAGSWSAYIDGGTSLDIDVDIPTLTGKLALIIGVGNEDPSTAQASSVTLNGVSATKAGQSRQGTGYSNTCEIWYFLNDDLPSTPGTYTLNITMNNSCDVAATAALLDIILQEAPVFYGSNDADQTSISTEVTINLDYVQNGIVFEALSSGDSEESTVDNNQTEISDIVFSTTALATSYGLYDTAGLETITRTYDASVNRIAHSLAVFKSGEEAHYTYLPSGGITISNDGVPVDYIEMLFEVDITSISISYVSSPANDRDIILSYTAETTALTISGTIPFTIHVVPELFTTTIVLSYDSDPLNDRTIEFIREAAPTTLSTSGVSQIDDLQLLPEIIIDPIILSYDSDPASDRDIILEYEASGIILLSGHTVVDFIDLLFEVEIIPITLNYDSSPADDRDIVFRYQPSGAAFSLGGTVVDFTELLFEVTITPITFSYLSNSDVDRDIIFERESLITLNTSGHTVVDFIELIFEVQIDTKLSLGGGDYYIEFERSMSGGIIIEGSVPELDFVIILFPTIVDPIALSGTTDENEIHIPATTEYGQIKLSEIIPNYSIEYSYTSKIFESPLILGTTSVTVEPTALFIHEATGFIEISGTIEIEHSQVFYYISTGRTYFKTIHRPPTYSYYPIYEYNASGVALTLLGGEWYTSIRAITPTGGIILSGLDITADQIIYDHRYVGSGGISLSGTYPYGAPVFITTISGKTSVKFNGTATGIKVSYIYEYTGSGIIIIRRSSIHRYTGTGVIYTSGAINLPEKSYTYFYTASGKISFTKIVTLIELSKFYYPFIYEPILVSGVILTTKIVVGYIGSGTIHISDPDSNFTYKSTTRLILRTSGIASYYISDISIIGSGKALLSGSAHYILAEPNTYKSSGIIYTTGTGVYNLNTSNFEYYASGAIYTNGLAYYAKYDKKPAPEFSYVSSGLLTTSGIAVYARTSVYVSLAAGRLVTTGIADSELHYEYISTGVINISGEADLAYTYLMTGILLISGISLTSTTPTYKYTASGFVKFVRIKSTYFRDLELLGRGRSVFSGSAVTIARYIYPDYQATAVPITLTGQSDYEYISNYSYESSGSLIITSLSLYEYEAVRFYEAAGQVNIKGDAESEYSAIYGYSFSGGLISSGIAEIKGGYKEITYIAEGAINTNGTSEDKLRYITLKISNGATAAAFQEKRTLKEPLAATVFRYKL
jgi:hypothetical protein